MELEAMDWDTTETYWLAITQIEAQELLLAIRVSQFPWLKRESQRSTHRQFHKMAYPRNYEKTETLTTKQLAERLQGL